MPSDLVHTNAISNNTNYNHTLAPQNPQNYIVGNQYQGYYANGYTCSACGVWVTYGLQHFCTGYHTYTVTVIPQVHVTPAPDPTQREILDELKLMRKALEILVERTVNDHEEVRRSDEGGSGDPSVDAEGGLEGTTLRDVAEIVKRLDL